MADDVVILNEGYELRTSKTGKTRFTLKVTAEPLVHRFSAKDLGKDVAIAIADLYRERILSITAIAAPATIRARQVAARAVAAGKAWALKRYGGGRMGTMPPNERDALLDGGRLFNDSGRMAKSITANASGDDAWRVNVAANRLDEQTADNGGMSAVMQIYARLLEFIPELAEPAKLLDVIGVQRALKNAQRRLIAKARESSSAAGLEAFKTSIENVVAADEALDEAAKTGTEGY